MAAQLFVVPLTTQAVGSGVERQPKYIPKTVDYQICDQGKQNFCLIGCNPDSTTLANLNAANDVVAIPVNLDTAPAAGPLATLQTRLEAAGIPATDFTTASTYRFILRRILLILRVLQRHHGIANDGILGGSITLDSTFSSLSANAQAALISTVNGFRLSSSGLTAGSTIRQIYMAIIGQFTQSPIQIFGINV